MKINIRTMVMIVSMAAVAILSIRAEAACPTIAPIGSALTAQVNFSAPTKNTDGTSISGALTYNVYQGTAPGAEIKVASGVSGTPIVINTGLQPSTSYYYQVTAVVGGIEGPLSNEVCKGFTGSVPGAVVITIT